MTSMGSMTRPRPDDSEAPAETGGTPGAGSVDGGATPPLAPESRMTRVARRAHELYEARGGQDGTAMEDWLTAERQVDEEIDRLRGPGESDRT